MRTRQKRRILPDTMIQEIGRSVKCQKLNKFINRTPKLSVNKPKARRGDQFPGAPRWLSGYAGTFYPLTVLPRRNLIPRQTHLFPGNARELLPAGAGGSVSPTGRKFLQIRAARHTATIHSSLFTILFPLAPPGGTPHPGKPAPLPGNARELLPAGAGGSVPWRPPMAEQTDECLLPSHSSAPEESHAPANPLASRERQRIAPRRGALTSWARSLSRLRVCGLGMSADFERKLLPAGAGGFPISWGYDKISAGAVGARFYTNKSGAKENHLCRELWVWPGRPLQNMI